MSFELNENDLAKLEQARFKHFREIFTLPPEAVQQLDLDCSLTLFVNQKAHLDKLLASLDELRWLAWLVYGAPHLEIWLNQSQAWEGLSVRCQEGRTVQSELSSLEGSPPMPATATIDREAIAQSAREEVSQVINTEIDTVIQEEVAGFLTGEALQLRVRERLQMFLGQAGTGKTGNGNAGKNGKNSATATLEAPAKTEAKPTAKGNALKLPKNLKAIVTNRYGQTLEKCMEGGDRAAILAAVANETEEGKEWLNRIATTVQKKFNKPNPQVIYNGLLAAARKLKG